MLEELKSCTKCGLSNTRKSVVTPSFEIPPFPGMLVVENPSTKENLMGKFHDGYWRTLDSILQTFGKSRNDFYCTSGIKCALEVNRHPTMDEFNSCKPYLMQEIMLVKPKAILIFGEELAKNIIPNISESMIGRIFSNRMCQSIIVTYHPNTARQGTDKYQTMISCIRKFIAKTLI